jgi:hypothetical protein
MPRKIIEPTETDPISLIIYGEPKQGKSAIAAALSIRDDINALIISNEPGGYAYLRARYEECLSPKELSAKITEIENDTEKLDILIVDTITVIDEWSEIIGTYNYMRSSQGKRFNLGSDGKQITHTHPDWESVHSLANGAGYRWSREWFQSTIEKLSTLAKKVIFIAHLKDKYIGQVGDDYLTAQEIDLTGKLKRILPSKVSGFAKFVRDKNKGYLSFENLDGSVAGARASHLHGKILISEKTDSVLVTYWEDIYTTLKNEKINK